MSLQGKPAQYQQAQMGGQQLDQMKLLQSLMGNGGAGLSQFFGGMGSPTTGLQRQSIDAMGQFLNQPAPEQRALETSMPMLQNILNGKPGQGVMDALQPQFDRNLASANQQGGRFGTGNAIMRSRALQDYNLLGAQTAQQGQQTQLQAADMLRMLSGAAGSAPFQRQTQAYGIGQQDAQQQDLETQRRIQLLAGLLGQTSGAVFNQPWLQTKSASPGWGGILAQLLGGMGGAAMGAIGAKAGGGIGDWLGGLFGGGGGGGGGYVGP